MTSLPDPELEAGWVDAALADEFPGLALWTAQVDVRPGRSPIGVRLRLRDLAGRITGAHVVHMRQDPVPWAYRVLWRQVGLDPDVDRPPAEALAVERLRAGELPSSGLVPDALTIATLETSVPVIAFDAGRVGRAIGLRPTATREWLGDEELPLSDGVIVVADEERPIATFTGRVAAAARVGRRTESMILASIQAPNVPMICVEEAIWTAAETVSAAD